MKPWTAAAALGVIAAFFMLAPVTAGADEPAPPSPQTFHVAAPSKAHGATIARIVAPTFARRFVASAKDARPVQASTAWSHQAQVLLVLAATTRDGRDWVKVRLGDRPNTAAGWIPRDRVRLGHTYYWVEVRRGSRRVTIYRKGKRIRRFKAVIGKPSTPTPLGLAAIYERNRHPTRARSWVRGRCRSPRTPTCSRATAAAPA